MKLLILGATGNTGKELVAQAIEENHDVTILVRDPSRISFSAERMNIVKGSVLEQRCFIESTERTTCSHQCARSWIVAEVKQSYFECGEYTYSGYEYCGSKADHFSFGFWSWRNF